LHQAAEGKRKSTYDYTGKYIFTIHPFESKYRTLKFSNARFLESVVSVTGGLAFLTSTGFIHECKTFDGDCMVLPFGENKCKEGLAHVKALLDKQEVVTAEGSEQKIMKTSSEARDFQVRFYRTKQGQALTLRDSDCVLRSMI
jgi:hypothetical protein